jgi:AAA+ superfamily predicted ATPase
VNLRDHLRVRTPLVWVRTDEAPRVLDEVLAGAVRPVFRIDPLDGFCRWTDGAWKIILAPDDDGAMMPTWDLNLALPIVVAAGGTLVLEHAHLEAPSLIGMSSAFSERFRRALASDDESLVRAQVIFLSCKDEVPPELVRMTGRVDHGLPKVGELETLFASFNGRLGKEPGPEALLLAARAAVGMSETEATTAALGSLAETGALDPTYLSRAKLEVLKAGGLLEIRQPTVSLKDIGGLDRAKKLIEAVSWSWRHPEASRGLGVVPLRRLLMIGLAGSGKSLLAEAAAGALSLELAKGGVSNAMSKWVGSSEANMRTMFRQIKAMAPIVFWVDELGRDLSGGASSAEVDGGTTDRVHGEFLTGLQELPEDVFLLAAANRIEHLPPEMTRADRFDKVMFVGFPTQAEREDIFRIHLGKVENVDISVLAKEADHYTGAEVKALVREVRFNVGASDHRVAVTADYLEAIPEMKGRIWVRHHESVLTMYERALDEWDWASSAQEEEAPAVLRAARHNPWSMPVPSGWKTNAITEPV